VENNSDIQDPKRSEITTIARGGGIGLAGNISMVFLTIGLQLVLARGLGPANVGLLGLGLSITNLAVDAVSFGMQRGVLRFVAHYLGLGDRSRTAGAILTALRILTANSLLIVPILFFGASFITQEIFHKPELTSILRVLALSIPITGLMQILIEALRGFKRVEYKFLIRQLAVPLLKISGAAIAIFVVGSGVLGVAYAILFATLVGAGLAVYFVSKHYPLRGIETEKAKIYPRHMLQFSWPLMLTSIFDRANSESETLVLGAFTTNAEVGIYYNSLKVTVFINVFLQAINLIFAPVIAEYHAKGEHERLVKMYRTVTRWAFTLALPVFLILFVFAEEVLMIFGQEFVEGASVLRILALSRLIFVATGPSGWILTMTGHPRLNFINTSLTLGIALVLDFLLVPTYGAVGAAVGRAVSIGLVNIMRLIEVKYVLKKLPYEKSYFKPIAAGILATIGSLALGLLLPNLSNLLRAGIMGVTLGGSFFLVLLLLGLENDEIVVLQALRQRLKRVFASYTRNK
jgi:O-antigen/teichoic acid export membrane protein